MKLNVKIPKDEEEYSTGLRTGKLQRIHNLVGEKVKFQISLLINNTFCHGKMSFQIMGFIQGVTTVKLDIDCTKFWDYTSSLCSLFSISLNLFLRSLLFLANRSLAIMLINRYLGAIRIFIATTLDILIWGWQKHVLRTACND